MRTIFQRIQRGLMPDNNTKLLGAIILIYEMEGLAGVERYAEANHIPADVCRKLLNDYLAAQIETNKDAGLGWPAA